MGKFLKEEWFKILLLLLAFYAVTLLYISNLSQEKPTIKNTATSIKTPQGIADQVKALDDFLEYDLIGTDLDCRLYATYNNVITYESPDDFKTGFPNSKDTYESKCRHSYVEMNANNKFVAEPELVDLRKAISEYANTVQDFSSYALGGGYSNSVINVFDNTTKTIL